MPGPAYTIHTPRLLLRCWNPEDARLLVPAIAESLDHLRPWMPWAEQEPESVEAKCDRLRKFRSDFDRDESFAYGIFTPGVAQLLGSIGLHARVGVGGLEIGYWIHRDHSGQGYATEAAGALTRVAFEVHGVDRVEIHCDPENHGSAAVARKLGYRHEATLRQRKLTPESRPRDAMIWTLFREEYASSLAATVEIEALDALARRVVQAGARSERSCKEEQR